MFRASVKCRTVVSCLMCVTGVSKGQRNETKSSIQINTWEKLPKLGKNQHSDQKVFLNFKLGKYKEKHIKALITIDF